MNVASRIPPEVARVFEGFSCTDAFACSAEWELVVRPIVPCCGLYYVHRNRWNVQQPEQRRAGCTRAITAASIKEHVRLRQHQWRSMYTYVSINGGYAQSKAANPREEILGIGAVDRHPPCERGAGFTPISSRARHLIPVGWTILLTVTMPTHRPPDPHVLYAIAIDPSALKIGLPGFVELNVTTSYLIVQGLCSSRAVRFMVQQYASSRTVRGRASTSRTVQGRAVTVCVEPYGVVAVQGRGSKMSCKYKA